MFFRRKEKGQGAQPQAETTPQEAAKALTGKHAPEKKRGALMRTFLKIAIPIAAIGGIFSLPQPVQKTATNAVGITATNDARPMPKIFGGVASRKVPFYDGIAYEWLVMRDHHAQEMRDPAKRAELEEFYKQFDDLRDKTTAEKAKAVDGRIDKIVAYTPDPITFCQSEYWATPLQTARLKMGDCEDFAIIKYYTLRHLGVPADKMFVAAVGHDGADHVNHATILVDISDNRAATPADARPGAAPYEWKPVFVELADDGIPRLVDITKPHEAAYYAMNETGVWSVTPAPGVVRPPDARPPKPPPTPPVKKVHGKAPKTPKPPEPPPCVRPSV